MAGSPADERLERRRQLLRFATLTFAQQGYLGATLGQIARRIGVTDAAIYRHFSSKEALFRAVVTEAPNALVERWRSITSVTPASDWLQTMAEHCERELDDGCRSLALQLHAASHSQTMRELVHLNTARLHDFVRQTALAARASGSTRGSVDADMFAKEFLSEPIRRRLELLIGIVMT